MSALLEVRRLAIPDVLELLPKRFGDHRGYLSEVYNRQRFTAETGVAIDFVQINQSLSAEKATLRGLHFQAPPFAQTKLVVAVTGAAFDVAVDIRRGSPTYGKWVSVTLSSKKEQPASGARRLRARLSLTLEPETVMQYQVDNPYAPRHEGGIRFDDPIALPGAHLRIHSSIIVSGQVAA